MRVVYSDVLSERAMLDLVDVVEALVLVESTEFARLVLDAVDAQDRGRGGVVEIVMRADPDSTGVSVGYLVS